MTGRVTLDLKKLLVGLFVFYICYTYCNNDLYESSRIGSNMTVSFTVLFLAGVIILFMNHFNILLDNIYIKCFAVFFIYAVISYLWSSYRVHQFYVLPFMISDLLLFFLFWNVAQYISAEKMLQIFIVAGCFAAIKMFLTVPETAYGILVSFEGIGGRNALGMCLSFSAAVCFCMYLIKKKWYYLGIMVYLYYAALMAGSKKGLLLGVLVIIICILMMRFSIKKVAITLAVVGMIAILYFVLMNNSHIYEIIGTRMQMFVRSLRYGGRQDISTYERLYLLSLAPEIIMERPVFGWGMNGFTGWVAKNTSYRATYSHNNYTEVLANFGIVGFAMYYWIYFFVIMEGIKNKRVTKENYINFLGVATIITMMALEMACVTYYDTVFQMLIMFAVIMVYQYGKKPELKVGA